MENCYMIEFELPEMRAAEFLDKIPQQRQEAARLMQCGIVKSYALSRNQSRLWIVVSAGSEFEALNIVSQLPLSRFMIPSISALLFHDAEADHFQLQPATSVSC